MGNLTVGQLRELLEGVADNVPVLRAGGDHSYSQCWHSGTGFSTALRDGCEYYLDPYLPVSGDGIGEDTGDGIRVRAFIIQ